jgi:hypothetical protein
LVFNLSRPELSLMLLAPLDTEAGGYHLCRKPGAEANATPVFKDTTDAGYRAILAMITAGKERLEIIGRFDMAGYRPPAPYLREMLRYGILEAPPAPGEPVDAYALDRAYWRSFDVGPAADDGVNGHAID